MIYTMQNLQNAINDIKKGKYVDLEVPAAYHAIVAIQNLGNDWDVFLENAPSAILCAQFQPLTFDDVEEYISNQLRHPRPNQNQPVPALIRNMLEDCKGIWTKKKYSGRRDKGTCFHFPNP